ncbi:ABC transporter substrate-binding protein [Amycolatopsis sp. EV170708-02-1]|uniref:ABC transporter substrate-binding protein n=1 Tax=Amycolatopsis sp. EV170708-02-1 TaxID=2919322 RepID=UPI001F0BEEEC|nr:ABC transporter substrate-binding protein [Amycolatopsis sp. EV170708-02-1]UMP03396.1 ABC transporter substrate-binding protein [Amycolatopsis sp. EV170708-02-1]
MKMKSGISVMIAAMLAGLAGCAGGGATEAGGREAAPGATAYPFSIKNCGIDVTFEAAPKRAVTMNQTAAEILIHLGVGDRIVGSGYENFKVPDDIAEQYKKIPILSAPKDTIKHEKLLEAQPDFVYSSFASFLTAAQGGEREQLHKLGVPTYVTEFDCAKHVSVANADFPMLYEEYRRLAKIFGVPAAGEKLASEQQAVVDKALGKVKKRDKPLRVMWFYSTYAGTPWAAGPGGLPQRVSELVGVKNIFDDASTKWAEVSWDEVAARNPDVIILADLTRGEPNDTVQEKLDLLKKDPLTSKLGAVAGNRFITLPGAQMDPSYGSVQMVPALVDALNEIP